MSQEASRGELYETSLSYITIAHYPDRVDRIFEMARGYMPTWHPAIAPDQVDLRFDDHTGFRLRGDTLYIGALLADIDARKAAGEETQAAAHAAYQPWGKEQLAGYYEARVRENVNSHLQLAAVRGLFVAAYRRQTNRHGLRGVPTRPFAGRQATRLAAEFMDEPFKAALVANAIHAFPRFDYYDPSNPTHEFKPGTQRGLDTT